MHIFIYSYTSPFSNLSFVNQFLFLSLYCVKEKKKIDQEPADEMHSGIEVFMSRWHSQCR